MHARCLLPRLPVAPLMFAGIAALSGCVLAPDRITWKPDQRVIAPSETSTSSTGTLMVETASLGNDNGTERRRNFHLYDERGNYLTHYNNDFLGEVNLPAGRYAVVSCVMFENKQVQVLIRDGYTTRVSLRDLQSAPEAN